MRTYEEIRENYNGQIDTTTPGLVGYWKFKGNTNSQEIRDSSTKGNHGVRGNSNSAASDDLTRQVSPVPLPLRNN